MDNFILSVVKIILAIVLLPAVVVCVVVFYCHLDVYGSVAVPSFLWGAGTFALLFLFLYQFWGVYEFGQSAMSTMFKFLSPVDGIVARILPFYMIIILAFFYAVSVITPSDHFDQIFLFFVGFSAAMHILLSAQDLQEQEKSPIKPTYLFSIGIITITTLCLAVLLLDAVARHFSFPSFFDDVIEVGRRLYEYFWLLLIKGTHADFPSLMP